MTEEIFFETSHNRLFCKKKGKGKKAIFIFHGFGQDHQLFEWLSDRHPEDYTYYFFDVFYHGKSTRPESELSKNEWKSIIKDILLRENLDRFDLLCFSLGGRFGIATLCQYAAKIDKAFLIAPDAILISIWYRFSTNAFFRNFFKYLMKNPDKFFILLNYLEKYKLVNRTLIQFARKELGPKDSRVKVYRSWVFLKALKYKTSHFVEQANKNDIDIHFLLGSKDRIIHPDEIELKLKNLKRVNYTVVPYKHHELIKPDLVTLLFKNTKF